MRKNPYGIVDVNNESEGDVAYCPNCEKGGIKVKLGDVIYGPNDIPKEDDDNWCMCSRCGKKYPIYERKEEGGYTFPFDIITNPFDSGSQFTSIGKRKKHDRLKDYRKDEDED